MHDADVVVVDVGPRGLRARRTGTDPEATVNLRPPVGRDQPGGTDRNARHDRNASVTSGAPGVFVGHGAVDALDAQGLLSTVGVLAGCTGSRRAAGFAGSEVVGPPAAVVFAVPDAARALDPFALLSGAQAVFRCTATAVVDASVATLAGAFGSVTPGVVLEMGLGARALATDFAGVWHRVDGWGPLFGDRGSAAWLGAQGLAAGLRDRDDVQDGSRELLRAGREAFGDESGWPAAFDRAGAAGVLADFAPVVGDLARRDAVAEGICRLAGEHLADTLCAGSRAVPGAPLAATGGLLLVDAVKVSLAAALARRHAFLLPALGDSLAGARVLAAHLAEGGRLAHRPPHVFVTGRNELG